MVPRTGRLAAAALVAGGLVVVAASCAESGAGSSTDTVTIKPASYEVMDPVTTSTQPVDTGPTAEGRSPVEQTYLVRSNDNPSQIAQLYEVDLDELREYNGWAADYSDFPGVDGTVRIPPNARYIDPNATTTSVAEETADTGGETEDTPSDGGGDDDCAPGTYTIEDGDTPILIADRFGVSLEALTEANGWDAEYSNFPNTGETITIPAPPECP